MHYIYGRSAYYFNLLPLFTCDCILVPGAQLTSEPFELVSCSCPWHSNPTNLTNLSQWNVTQTLSSAAGL